MKLLSIVNTNIKGQIVIPKEIRNKLGINQKVPLSLEIFGTNLLIKPIKNIITDELNESSYLDILKSTKGKWPKDSKISVRGKKELEASERRKKEW